MRSCKPPRTFLIYEPLHHHETLTHNLSISITSDVRQILKRKRPCNTSRKQMNTSFILDTDLLLYVMKLYRFVHNQFFFSKRLIYIINIKQPNVTINSAPPGFQTFLNVADFVFRFYGSVSKQNRWFQAFCCNKVA